MAETKHNSTAQGTASPSQLQQRASSTSEKTHSESPSTLSFSISTSDLASLRRVRASIPPTVWAAAFMGMFERFAFYGASAPFQNYMQNSIDDPFRVGALGMGQAKATIVNYAFITFGFLTPVPMAVVADKWTGRYLAILGSFA
jgi:POT family proton-dependent oligopeptide transporter